MTKWNRDSLPDLSGRTYVITGANSGLGLATAQALAGAGGRVVLTGRNPDKLRDSMELIRAQEPVAEPESVILDLASLASIRGGAAEIRDRVGLIDVLINNAGVMGTPHRTTADGFEMQMGTNHLGHFALTGLLLPDLPHHDSDSRVVTVASLAHRGARVHPEDLHFEDRAYSSWLAYGQSKMANLLFTHELAKRAAAAGWSLRAIAVHPGFSATNLFSSGPSIASTPVGRAGNMVVETVLSQSAEDGALPTLYAACAPDAESGEYYGPDGLFEIRGTPTVARRSSAATDDEVAEELWQVSEAETGVVYDFAD